MNEIDQQGKRLRADVQRNRTALLETAQRHFARFGVGTSLEAVAKEAGVGPGTLYRHFATREDLLAAVLQTRSETLLQRQAECESLDDPAEALDRWLLSMELYFSAFSGLPGPLMAAAQARDPENPLSIPCNTLIAVTEKFLRSAQELGHARKTVEGVDLFLSVCSIAWIRGNEASEESLDRLRALISRGYRADLEASRHLTRRCGPRRVAKHPPPPTSTRRDP